MKIFGWTKKDKNINNDITAKKAEMGLFIDSAYSRRSKEIESLRKYDRGEKEITPSNVRGLSRSI